jgi:long-chain acyl-CoA synthetase
LRGPARPDLNETYASSETGYLTAISSAEARVKPGSAGRPLKGVSIKILDDDGNEVKAGVIGKIYARHFATSLFTYINREDDRKAIEHDGYVTVGDVGYVDDEGYLYVSDRRTDLVLSGGVNIYPAEIEQALVRESFSVLNRFDRRAGAAPMRSLRFPQ